MPIINFNKTTRTPTPASGIRVSKSSFYSPESDKTFNISRSKVDDFLKCPKCFLDDRRGGIIPPGQLPFNLNIAVDENLKQSFDVHRVDQTVPPLLRELGLGNYVPYQHEDLPKWRSNFKGIRREVEGTNITLSGAVDDLWLNKDTGQISVVDYKSTSTKSSMSQEDYLNDGYHDSYKRQLDFYNYLLRGEGLNLSASSFFLVFNARKDMPITDKNPTLTFDYHLIEYKWDDSWVEDTISRMIKVLNYEVEAVSNPCCKHCAFVRETQKYAESLKGECYE